MRKGFSVVEGGILHYFNDINKLMSILYSLLKDNGVMVLSDFPDCYLRFYTLSEIINSVIINGFELKKFDEHPKWENEKIPGEFTILAVK